MKLTLALAATSAALLAAGTAQAAPTVTSIRINNSGAAGSGQSFLQIAELQVFSGLTNIAPTGTATASSVYSDVYGGPSTAPGKAIDGQTDGQYFGSGFYHSTDSSTAEFFNLSFAAAQTVNRLSIFGRTDCCSFRDSYVYTLFNGANVVRTGTLDARDTSFATVSFGGVPEPATWGLMILGFGAVGAAMRRRRVTTAVRFA